MVMEKKTLGFVKKKVLACPCCNLSNHHLDRVIGAAIEDNVYVKRIKRQITHENSRQHVLYAITYLSLFSLSIVVHDISFCCDLFFIDTK